MPGATDDQILEIDKLVRLVRCAGNPILHSNVFGASDEVRLKVYVWTLSGFD